MSAEANGFVCTVATLVSSDSRPTIELTWGETAAKPAEI